MASITSYPTKRGDRWMVQYTKPDGARGKKRGLLSKDAAEGWWAKNRSGLDRGDWVDPALGKTRLETIGAAWLATQTHLKPSTYRTTEQTWRVHVKPKWGGRQISSIRKSEVQQWVSNLDRGPSVVGKALQCLAQVLDAAIEDGMISVNPARGVKKPKKAPPVKVYLTMGQVRALAEECTKHGEIVWTLATVGLRWSELAGLKVKDLDLDGRRAHLQRAAVTVAGHEGQSRRIEVGTLKGHENRTVAVPRFVCNMLAGLVEGKSGEDWVWEKDAGGPLWLPGHGHWYYEALGRLRRPSDMKEAERDLKATEQRRKAREDARFPWVTPHGLRHVAAGLLVGSGANVKVVQRQLGHKDATMTLNTYADLFDGDLDVVADAMEAIHTSLGEPKVSQKGLAEVA